MTVHPATLSRDALLAQCDMRQKKASGPGGQRRNKVETGVVIAHAASGCRGEATERRDRLANERVALFRLRLNLALRVRGTVPTKPSELWTSRAGAGQIRVNAEHADFPALLAEALDVVHAHDFDARAAAAHLGLTASQLVKFIKLEPRAMAAWNATRFERGEHKLR